MKCSGPLSWHVTEEIEGLPSITHLSLKNSMS